MRRIDYVVAPSFTVQPRIATIPFVDDKIVLDDGGSAFSFVRHPLDELKFDLGPAFWGQQVLLLLGLVFLVYLYLFCSLAWLYLDVMLDILNIRAILNDLLPFTAWIWVFFILFILLDAVQIFNMHIWGGLASLLQVVLTGLLQIISCLPFKLLGIFLSLVQLKLFIAIVVIFGLS